MQHTNEILQIDPKELDVEFTLDPSKFISLTREVEEVKQVRNPILVWYDPVVQRLRIIDGFHRTFVAQNLGLPIVSYILFEGTEQEFWNARIRESLPHTAIEADRINDWILSAWKSEFPEVDRVELEKISAHVMRNGVSFSRKPLAKSESLLLEWFRLKAEAWHKTAYELADIVLRKTAGLNHPDMPQIVQKTPDLASAKTVVKLMPNSGVKVGATPKATSKDLADFTSDVVDKGVETPFKLWLAGREEEKKPKAKVVERVVKTQKPIEDDIEITDALLFNKAESSDPRIHNYYTFFKYGIERLTLILSVPQLFSKVPKKYVQDMNDMYILLKELLSAFDSNGVTIDESDSAIAKSLKDTRKDLIIVKSELNDANIKIRDLEEETKRLKNKILLERAERNRVMSSTEISMRES